MNKHLVELLRNNKQGGIKVDDWRALVVATGMNEGELINTLVFTVEQLLDDMIKQQLKVSELNIKIESLESVIKTLKEEGSSYKLGSKSVANGRKPGRKPTTDVELIKKLYKIGYSYRDIANKLGISISSVYRVLRQAH